MSKSPEYVNWCGMFYRCTKPTCKRYRLYGGRGIHICARWKSFENFFKDMGKRPTPKHTLGRIDNNLGYSPGNCEWQTQKQQMANYCKSIRITMNGETTCLSEWCRRLRLPYQTIKMRIWRNNWDPNKAISAPIRKGNYKRKDKQ